MGNKGGIEYLLVQKGGGKEGFSVVEWMARVGLKNKRKKNGEVRRRDQCQRGRSRRKGKRGKSLRLSKKEKSLGFESLHLYMEGCW